ncbi:MAG TPA: DUF423 domain-containing protein [Flavobacteriales bacterium]|nr:DUF423 domain-containing protein [Flavobacteriales bacterium]
MNKRLFQTACCLTALGIILGAFAAHGLKEKISPANLDVFETGVKYHLLHALALVVLAFQAHHFESKKFKIVKILFFAGILFFSGSIYALATIEINGLISVKKALGPITPLGGLCLISGWLLLVFSVKKS